MRKYHLVYCTTNLINGKQYVGVHSTNDLNDGYLGSGNVMRKAFRKYKRKNFNFKILFNCESKEETYWIERIIVNEWFLFRWGFGKYFYNQRLGGGIGSGETKTLEWRKYEPSESDVEKLSSCYKSKNSNTINIYTYIRRRLCRSFYSYGILRRELLNKYLSFAGSQQTIANDLGISRRCVIYNFNTLIKYGYMKKVKMIIGNRTMWCWRLGFIDNDNQEKFYLNTPLQ